MYSRETTTLVREKIIVGDCVYCGTPVSDFCPRCHKPCHEKHVNTEKKLAQCMVPYHLIGKVKL